MEPDFSDRPSGALSPGEMLARVQQRGRQLRRRRRLLGVGGAAVLAAGTAVLALALVPRPSGPQVVTTPPLSSPTPISSCPDAPFVIPSDAGGSLPPSAAVTGGSWRRLGSGQTVVLFAAKQQAITLTRGVEPSAFSVSVWSHGPTPLTPVTVLGTGSELFPPGYGATAARIPFRLPQDAPADPCGRFQLEGAGVNADTLISVAQSLQSRTSTATGSLRFVPAPTALGPAKWAGDVADLRMLSDAEGWAVGFACPGCQVPVDVTTDGGASWRRVASPVAAVEGDASFALSLGPGPQLWLWSRWNMNSLPSALFRSLDGGRTWSQIVGLGGIDALAVEPDGVWVITESCPLTGTVAACTERLMITSDDGRTWDAPTAQPSLPTGAGGVALVRIDTRHAWVLSSRPAGGFVLAATRDGGATWTTDPDPPQRCAGVPFGLAAADARHLWLGCGGNGATIEERREVAVSDDGGRTWTVTQDAVVSGQFANIALASPSTGFIGQCRGPLQQSHDQGHTWTDVTPNAPLDGCVRPVEFLDPNHGWVAGQTASGAWVIWRTTDGGASWSYASLV